MSFVDRLHKKNIVAKPGFNRWLVPPASIAIHLCTYCFLEISQSLSVGTRSTYHEKCRGIWDA